MRYRILLCVALMVVGVTVPARASEDCSAAEHPGGDWPSVGQNIANTRQQPSEDVIGVDTVGGLEPLWVFKPSTAGDADGVFYSTPAVAGGCVFVATSSGHVFALDADSGALVWKAEYDASGGQVPGLFGLTVADGRVHGGAADADGAYAFALDASTGDELWRTPSNREVGEAVNASAVVHNGIQLLAAWGEDANPEHHNAIAMIDAATGEVLKTTFVVPKELNEEGYAGGGIWATAAIDEATGFAFVGTANPYSKRREHEHTNAIIKIDMNRGSSSFGEIVDSYKGTPDNYVAALYDQPLCDMFGDDPTLWYASYSAACAQLDIDFGGSPALFTGDDGRTIVAELQKSGVLHAAYTDDMSGAWQQTVAPPSLLGNSSPVAYDGKSVITTPNLGVTWSFDGASGALNWASPYGDAARYQPPSVANGVVYTTDGSGNLIAFDGETGLPVLRRSASSDATTSGSALTSSGVSIAQNNVFVPVNDALVVYGLPE